MKQLFITISWLEFVRNKSRSWLLVMIVLAFAFMLSTCGNTDMQLHMSSNTTQSSSMADDHSLPMDQFLTAMPALLITSIASVLGFLVLVTIPFRGKQEWENGQFQMIAMGDYSFYKVEFARFLGYVLLAALFFIVTQLCFGLYAYKYDVLSYQTIVNMQLMAIRGFVGFMPLMLAFGVFVSAINTAYYRDGHSKLLTLVKYVSCFSFFILTLKTANWFDESSYKVLPVMEIPFEIPSSGQQMLSLSWEFPVLSLLVTILLVFWSGRILEEVEA